MDTESLALYAEGRLGHRRTAQIRAHLPGCAACSATVRQLTEVSGLLGQVPTPALPPAVAARLDAALAAELTRRASPEAAGTAPAAAGGETAGGATGTPPADGRSPGSPDTTVPPAGLPAAPLAGTPLAGTPLAGTPLAGTPGGPPGATGSPGRPGAPPRPDGAPPGPGGGAGRRPGRGHTRRARGPGRGSRTGRWARRWPTAQRLAATAGVLAVLAAGGYGLSRLAAAPSPSGAPGSASAPHAAAALPTFSSHLNYQPHTLGQQAAQALRDYQHSRSAPGAVPHALAGGPASTAGSGTAGSPTPGSTGQGLPGGAASRDGAADEAPGMFGVAAATLQRCAGALAAGRQVELVDRASYAGQPAIIVVVAARGQAPAYVWAVGLGCRPGHPDRLAGAPLGG